MTENSDEHGPGERSMLDSTGEFFSVGTPLHAVRAGYVQRTADTVLYESINAGRYAHVIAPDRNGKSSLIAATAARLEMNGQKVAILDLEQIGGREAGSDEGRWYYSIAYRLLRQLRIRIDLHSWWQDKSMLSNRQRLLEFYSEIILQHVSERVVVFVDEIQCIAELEFADQLLSSIRAAHNARTTDPEFSRITFVLLGECDPVSLIGEPELSPFNVTQAVTLDDFSREDLDLFATELNLEPKSAAAALDRVYFWTAGQPYLTQKLARMIAREQLAAEQQADIVVHVDRIALRQLAGRAALHSEPHMSHMHRQIVNDERRREALLNLYGRICKNVHVATDLGSPLQRRLIAIGLVVIDEEGRLRVRNRLYESVFTTRWANENLPNNWRAPAIAVASILAIVFIPFWYTQLLPRDYVELLTADGTDLAVAASAYESLQAFPGHDDAANNLYRGFLQKRAALADDMLQIEALASLAEKLPAAGDLPTQMVAGFWDRKSSAAMRNELREEALLATLESLAIATPQRRNRAAMLISSDYPLLISSLSVGDQENIVFNPQNLLLTATSGSQVSQWTLGNQEFQRRENWPITALEVAPLVRRVIVDSAGTVRRIGLTINLSHARVGDLRIKLIAPSGRAVEVEPRVERASSNQDIRISSAQLQDLLGESITGTWSLSVRDEELSVAGQLVGWNLQLNSQGLVEDFQRGLNISDPVERETNQIWLSGDGKFAIARATQDDSARIWDLALAKPLRAVAVAEQEQFLGLSEDLRLLVTATQYTVNLWDTTSGDRVTTLDIGAASGSPKLTRNGTHLLAERRNAADTRFDLWSLSAATVTATLDVAGSPALVSLDETGTRIAIADHDRAVRVWDFQSGELLAQIDLAKQPSRIELAAGGQVLGVLFGTEGAALWRIDNPKQALYEEFGRGDWSIVFAPSGTQVLIGRPRYGYQVHASSDGQLIGPAIDAGSSADTGRLLGFSADEQIILTGGHDMPVRYWKTPTATGVGQALSTNEDRIWPPAGDAVVVATPDAQSLAIGDRQGDVHIFSTSGVREALLADNDDVSFLGHNRRVRTLAMSPDGAAAASAANDNTIRVWNTADGLPRPFFGHISGNPIERMVFSPDATRLGVLSSNQVHIINAADGSVLVELALGEPHQALAFDDKSQLYLGSDSGSLSLLQQTAGGDWGLQVLWQGGAGIRWLEVSPRSRFLIVVDQNNLAQQFILAEGHLAASPLQLPGPVEEVRFSPNGSRVLFRTARWIHRANSALSGLRWIDAVFAPRSISAARMVFGTADTASAVAGSRIFLPVTNEGFVQLLELHFDNSHGVGLFGNREELGSEWRHRFGMDQGDN